MATILITFFDIIKTLVFLFDFIRRYPFQIFGTTVSNGVNVYKHLQLL